MLTEVSLGLFISLNFRDSQMSLKQCKPAANSGWEIVLGDAEGEEAISSGFLAEIPEITQERQFCLEA